MSGLYQNHLTDDDTEPEFLRCLLFKINWKNVESVSGEENCIPKQAPSTILGHFNFPHQRDWDSFKANLKGEYNGPIRVTYVDSDCDEIPIESQCEFAELLKYCKNHDYSTRLNVEKGNAAETIDTKKKSKNSNENDSARKTSSYPLRPRNAMTTAKLDDCIQEFGRTVLQSQLNDDVTQPEVSGDTAPKWFTNYMQTMKDEIIAEVSKRVTKNVTDALNKKNPYVIDSEYLRDSDIDDRFSLIEQVSSNEKKAAGNCSRSGAHRFESSRRRCRHAEKQRKKHTKNNGFQASNSDEIWHSPSYNRRRGDKASRNKSQIEEARALPQNSERSELIFTTKNAPNVEKIGENVDTPYRRRMMARIEQKSQTPVNFTDRHDPPILKLRLANPYNERNTEPKITEEKLRMGCSVTGDDSLEKPNDRVPDYCVLSDSDNISIISDVSDNSDMQQINNSFEMILQQSSSFINDVEDDRAQRITSEFQETAQDIDDHDNTRDSSSFELLSEPPPSPPRSIHMDEDHFATEENKTSDYNINEETKIDKPGNQSKIDKYIYAIDAHGKIYQQNIVDGDEECADIVLEKRTGGAYSFVGEALPASTKESVIFTDKPDTTADETFIHPSDISNDTEVEDTAKESPVESQCQANFSYTFHESTQSFHSHTAQQADNDKQDFAGFQSAEGREAIPSDTSRSHIFVDRNASKGLGDTKRSSPRKQSSTSNKCFEDRRSERSRSNRKTSHDSHGTDNRNTNSRHDRSRRFVNWSTTHSSRIVDDLVLNGMDPMHILPETLVTGAVQVASSAYTTARRVYNKILTAQTRKPADRSQSKFGRR